MDLSVRSKEITTIQERMYSTFTDEQQQIYDFFTSGAPKALYRLDAPAGTGKTFLVKAIAQSVRGVKLLAPTHKACSIYKPIWCSTIHQFFRAEQDYDQQGNQVYFFNPDLEYLAEHYCIIIVDECSMVDSNMFNAFRKVSKLIPVLFVGDVNYQLPPVQEQQSPVSLLPVNFALTKNMRSRHSISAHIVQSFRECVDTQKYYRVEQWEPLETLIELFKEDKEDKEDEEDEEAIILTYTNKQATSLNKQIRHQLFSENPDKPILRFNLGEKLVFSGYRATPERSYYSNDIFTIVNPDTRTEFIEFYNCEHSRDENKVKKCSDCEIAGHKTTGYNIRLYVITDDRGTEWLYPCQKEDKDKLKKLEKHLKDHIKHMVTKKKAPSSEWKEYYKFVETYLPKLNYSYASTIHKSQGSQWKHVFVDIQNIRACCRDDDIKFKLLYTAVSRMSEQLYFYKP